MLEANLGWFCSKWAAPILFFHPQSLMEKITKDFLWNGGDYKAGSHLVKCEITSLLCILLAWGWVLKNRKVSLRTKWLWHFATEENAL